MCLVTSNFKVFRTCASALFSRRRNDIEQSRWWGSVYTVNLGVYTVNSG